MSLISSKSSFFFLFLIIKKWVGETTNVAILHGRDYSNTLPAKFGPCWGAGGRGEP